MKPPTPDENPHAAPPFMEISQTALSSTVEKASTPRIEYITRPEIRDILYTDEPERTSRWLRMCFMCSATGIVSPKLMFDAYRRCLEGQYKIKYHEPLYDLKEFVRAMAKVFTSSYPGGTEQKRFVKGIVAREVPLTTRSANERRNRRQLDLYVQDGVIERKDGLNTFAQHLMRTPLFMASHPSSQQSQESYAGTNSSMHEEEPGFPGVSLRRPRRRHTKADRAPNGTGTAVGSAAAGVSKKVAEAEEVVQAGR